MRKKMKPIRKAINVKKKKKFDVTEVEMKKSKL